MNSTKGVKYVFQKSEHYLPHMCHPSPFTKENSHTSQLVKKAIQHMWHRSVSTMFAWRPYNFLKVVFSFCEEYPYFNNFETSIDPLNRKSSYFEKKKPSKHHYAGDSGILLLKYGVICNKAYHPHHTQSRSISQFRGCLTSTKCHV